MIKIIFVIFPALIFEMHGYAQTSIDTGAIQKVLNAIYDRDQKTRAHGDSIEYIAYIDSSNLVYVEKLILQYGWPGRSLIGARGNYIVFLVIQHADLATQEKYLPMLENSVLEGESRPVDLAYLQDRVLMRQGKKQIFGSQVVFNEITGDQKFYPIEDEKNVNIRRAQVGLGPIEGYAENFGIDYKVPKE